MKRSRGSDVGSCRPGNAPPHRGFVRGLLALAGCLCVALSGLAQETNVAGSGGQFATAWQLSDDQQGVVSAHGYPDSFTIVSVSGDPEEPGRRYRMETWQFHADQVVVIFVDGDEHGTKALDWPEAEAGPTTEFHPEEFAIGMAVRKVEARVFGSASGQTFGVPDDSPEYHAVSHGRLELGFEDGVLVYVDTSPDLPDDEWRGGE